MQVFALPVSLVRIVSVNMICAPPRCMGVNLSQVALRMKSAGKSVRALDTIPYVIAEDGTELSATYAFRHHPSLIVTLLVS